MRTQGDDVAELLWLLGVRPVWDDASRRVTGLEVVPLAELGRPRVDVTIRISGFFREAFPHVVTMLDDAVQLVAELDEPADENYVRAHVGADVGGRRRAAPGQARVFGSKPGAYGAGLLPLMDARSWRSDADLAEVYAVWGGYAYGRGLDGAPARGDMERTYARMQVAAKNQDTREHDIVDSDDYFQYHGGMVAMVRHLTGSDPAAYVGDSAVPDQVRTRTLGEETKRVFRARVVNPRWIAAMQRHGYKGAFEMAATVDYLFGYDATAGVVDDWMYETLTREYVQDPRRQRVHEALEPVGAQGNRGTAGRGGAARAVGRTVGRGDAGPAGRHPGDRGRPRGGGPMSHRSTRYPFTAVVGMDDLRLALVLSAVSPSGRRRAGARREGHRQVHDGPRAGGAAARGRRGHRLPVLLRPGRTRPGLPGRPAPARRWRPSRRPARLVELPVGATEDRVLGSLHLERALAHGETAYEPGLLAGAHRGVLYVDEVNLLADHLVDVLLDAAAMGRSTVEREGVSASHAARFVLVGTMNPEEGELRPQLLDRFGLTVEVAASRDAAGPGRGGAPPARRTRPTRPRSRSAGRTSETELAERIARAQRLVAGRRPDRCGAAAGRRGVRRLRGRRAARRPGDRPRRGGARRVARTPGGGDRGRAGRRPAGAAAPGASRPVRPARPGRAAARGRPRGRCAARTRTTTRTRPTAAPAAAPATAPHGPRPARRAPPMMSRRNAAPLGME